LHLGTFNKPVQWSLPCPFSSFILEVISLTLFKDKLKLVYPLQRRMSVDREEDQIVLLNSAPQFAVSLGMGIMCSVLKLLKFETKQCEMNEERN
jgi:hypothetical protein